MCSVWLGWLNLMVTVVEKIGSVLGIAEVKREASACPLTERKERKYLVTSSHGPQF